MLVSLLLAAVVQADLDAIARDLDRAVDSDGFSVGLAAARQLAKLDGVDAMRLRLTDFQTDGSGLLLQDVRTLRFDFGAGAGSAQGRLGLDDVELVKDTP